MERAEEDLKSEGGWEGEVVLFRSADRSSSFSQPTALVFKFS